MPKLTITLSHEDLQLIEDFRDEAQICSDKKVTRSEVISYLLHHGRPEQIYRHKYSIWAHECRNGLQLYAVEVRENECLGEDEPEFCEPVKAIAATPLEITRYGARGLLQRYTGETVDLDYIKNHCAPYSPF
jgi:hypothetical protein